MDRLISHFRRVHQIDLCARTAHRLAVTVRAMGCLDAGLQLGIMGEDLFARVPRRADVTLRELRDALQKGRRHVA